MPDIDPTITALREWIEVFYSRSMRSFIRYSKNRGLTMPQLGALFHLHHLGACSVTDLGDELGVTGAAASQMMERMVQQGLILRTEDLQDRRVKNLVLTETGTQVIQESVHARQDWLNDLVKSLSVSEKEKVIAALNILIDKTKLLENQSVVDS